MSAEKQMISFASIDDDVVGVDRGTRNHPTILWITVRPGFAMNRLVKWNRQR